MTRAKSPSGSGGDAALGFRYLLNEVEISVTASEQLCGEGKDLIRQGVFQESTHADL